MEHDDLCPSGPFGQVTLAKTKAHTSLDDAADHFEKLCCHCNELADAVAKKAVKQSRLVFFAQLQALHLHSKQLQMNKMVARCRSFLADCEVLQLRDTPSLKLRCLMYVGQAFSMSQ